MEKRRSGEILRRLRLEKGYSQKELAEKINAAQNTISQYEKGVREPDNKILIALSEIFNVSIDFLLGKKDMIKETEQIEEKDILKELEKMMKELEEQGALMFDGEPIDEETKEALKISLENTLRLTKLTNKKYIPKKYRKED